MKETLKMMKSILTGKEGEVDEKKLIQEYQEKLSPNILAYFYCNNYSIIYKISNKYTNLLSEDKASFCLQELDNCLRTFDINKNLKFITYFLKVYVYRLNNLYHTKKYNYSNLDSLETVKDLYCIDNLFEDCNILDNSNLTNRERIQCDLLNKGYNLKEIAKILKISISAVSQKNSIIRKKILTSYLTF